MPVTPGMFLFEVVIEKVNSLVESRCLIIRSDFADIFSLELKDPKQMYIVIPEPPPPPPDPPGKKKKPPKPKGKKGKQKEAPPPPEPVIQSGQSVLIASTAEFLIENMIKCPLEVSLWSKEDNLTYIGAVSIPWDYLFLTYLKRICNCEEPPSVTVREEYNIFQEGLATLMAKIGLQVKLSFLNNKVTTSFRTLSEDASIKKLLYTGMNSKTTSFMCTLKTTDEDFEENCNKIENQYIIDKPKPKAAKIVYADYKSAPGADLAFFKEGDYCCMGHADKPPNSVYKAPETCPDIDFIIDYVRKIIISCNDQMRMLTPRPTISPRVRATDIDRYCYCRETTWPPGSFAERFRRAAQSEPCPICIDAGKKSEGNRPAVFDIANIRGPCGRAECRIARDLRAYIEHLVAEDNKQIDINEIVGPCGSKECTLATKIKEFLRHEGPFTGPNVLEGLSTQCACIARMQAELKEKESCASVCSDKECEKNESDDSHCAGPSCPYDNPDIKKVYDVYYFTVEHDFENNKSPTKTPPKSDSPTRTPDKSASGTGGKSASQTPGKSVSAASSDHEDAGKKFPYCPPSCPSVKFAESASCSKQTCAFGIDKPDSDDTKCTTPVCKTKEAFPPSPADSNIEIKLKDIYNPCCVKSCDIADRVKEFIDSSVKRNESRKKCKEVEDIDPCYCDCVCNFNFSGKTTYCAVCGGYECLGDDTKDLPAFAMPHPCPVYHKLYDKKYIKVKSPWPDEEKKEEPKKEPTKKIGSRAGLKTGDTSKSSTNKQAKSTVSVEKETKMKEEKAKPKAKEKKPDKDAKASAAVVVETPPVEKKVDLKTKYAYPPVPKNMGWNWTAEDIPGMKPRAKWKPGAALKVLVRRYRAIREGQDTIAKKKRALLKGKKKADTKPTLTVTKRDGEFTVQMEVFKKYSKERLLHQCPYDEKPPLVYTIGKTELEKNKKQKQRDRKARRDTRRKCKLLQSTFRDRCQEICLKAYNQAIGLLPLPDPNNPDCPCMTNNEAGPSPVIDSCSCSDEGTISSSDTDHDEWVIEFTPPSAKWDVKAKHPPILQDNETMYNYLDYKVKILDKNGNQVPRYFTSHEGKQECSDLGGFWGPGHQWLEINKDGYIGPDGRWIPMNFVGPDGMYYSAEDGFITDATGHVLKLGIDGYIDKDLNWVWYPRRRSPTKGGSPRGNRRQSKAGSKGGASTPGKTSPTKGSSNKGEGDKAAARGGGDKTDKDKKSKAKSDQKTTASSTRGGAKHTVMSVLVGHDNRIKQRRSVARPRTDKKDYLMENRKIAKYHEIMRQLQMYDEFPGMDMRPPVKTNRASNTPSNKNARVMQDTAKIVPSVFYVGSDGSDASPMSSMFSPQWK